MTGQEAPAASETKEEETDFEDEFAKIAGEKDGITDSEPEEDLDKALDKELDDAEKNLEAEADKLKNKDGELEGEDKALEGLSDEDKVIYAELSDPAKERMLAMLEENKDLNHRIDSDAGRVSAFQRKVNGLEKEIQGIREGGTAGEQPSKTQIAEAMGGTDEEWDNFSKDYPEVAKAIDNRLDKAGQATQESVDSTLAPVKEKQKQDEMDKMEAANQAATDEVSETYPEWVEAIKKPEFAHWLEAQPPGIRSLSDSDDAKDASALVGLYDDHLVAEGKPTLKADPENNGVDTKDKEKQQEKEAEAKSLAKRRKQQLSDGAAIQSKNARVDSRSEPVDDFEAAFNFHANRKEKRRA